MAKSKVGPLRIISAVLLILSAVVTFADIYLTLIAY
jgi:hypothetical protein